MAFSHLSGVLRIRTKPKAREILSRLLVMGKICLANIFCTIEKRTKKFL